MRQARFLPLRRRWLLGAIPACALAVAGWGCQQPPCCFYYGAPPCAPVVPAPSAVQYGSVCDVPTQVVEGGTSAAEGSGRSTTVSGSHPPRVVVSEPADRPRLPWRPTDPDGSPAITSVEGAIGDSSVKR
jgi:hypothetical protein